MKAINELKETSVIELIDLLNKELKKFAKDKYNEIKDIEPKKTHLEIVVNIKDWNSKEKENLYKDILCGIFYFYFRIKNKKTFDVGNFNSLKKAINGSDFVYVNKNAIKWFSPRIKNKLRQEGYIFEDLEEIKKSLANEEPTYTEYSGSYAQDYMGLSDQDIDDAFEGEPDMYWNID